MKKFIFGILSLTVIVGGCTSEDIPYQESTQTPTSNRLSLDEALTNADAFFATIDGNTRTVIRKVGSVKPIGTSSSTRSEADIDTLLYLVNYADNNGFALLGADQRVPAVYAISPEGSWDYEAVKANPYLQDFLTLAKDDAESKIQTFGITDGGVSIVPTPIYQTTYRIDAEYKPLVAPAIRHVNPYSSPSSPYYATPVVAALTKVISTIDLEDAPLFVWGNMRNPQATPSASITFQMQELMSQFQKIFDRYENRGADGITGIWQEFHFFPNQAKWVELTGGYLSTALTLSGSGQYPNPKKQALLVKGEAVSYSSGEPMSNFNNSNIGFVVDGMIERTAVVSDIRTGLIKYEMHETLMHCLWCMPNNPDGYYLHIAYPQKELCPTYIKDEDVTSTAAPTLLFTNLIALPFSSCDIATAGI